MDTVRTVHAIAPDGAEIVRYNTINDNKSRGIWAIEWPQDPLIRGRRVRVHVAAKRAFESGAEIRFGLVGGKMFDIAIKGMMFDQKVESLRGS